MSDILNDPMPISIAINWIEQCENKKDAVDYAKGYIDARFNAKDSSWYSVQPFMGGWFWEVHEGGPGKGYLGSIISEMTANQGGEYWVPAGPKKVIKIMMRDGKPASVMLSESESLKVRNSGQAPLIAKSRMSRFASQGTGMLVFGATLAGSSFVYMLASFGFYLSVWQPGPVVRAIDLAQMPHAQWSKVENTGPEQIVSKLEMKGGVWQQPEYRQHIIADLEKERQQSRVINAAFDKQTFSFEGKEVGNKLNPSPTTNADGQPATLVKPVQVPVDTATSPANQQKPTQPVSAIPGPAQNAGQPTTQSGKPVTPVQPTSGSPDEKAVDSSIERQQRVMEQLRQLRERNAAAQKQAKEVQKALDEKVLQQKQSAPKPTDSKGTTK